MFFADYAIFCQPILNWQLLQLFISVCQGFAQHFGNFQPEVFPPKCQLLLMMVAGPFQKVQNVCSHFTQIPFDLSMEAPRFLDFVGEMHF